MRITMRIIDAHAHIWKGNYSTDRYEILKAMDLYGISQVYVSGLGCQYPDSAEITELNQEVADFMRENPGRIKGFCYLNPRLPDTMDTLRRGIEQDGMSGIKLWIATYCNDPTVFPIVEAAIRYRVPVLIHAFKKTVGQLPDESLGIHVAQLAARYPEAKLIMAHLGANCYDGIKPIAPYPNVSVDISGSMYRRDELDYTKKYVGAKRMIFGSDMPGANVLVNLGQVLDADLTETEQNWILSENMDRLVNRDE